METPGTRLTKTGTSVINSAVLYAGTFVHVSHFLPSLKFQSKTYDAHSLNKQLKWTLLRHVQQKLLKQ